MSGVAARRILHAGTAAVLLLQPLVSHAALRLAVVALAGAAVAVDTLRLRSPAARGWLHRLIPVFRPAETTRLSGGAWLWIGYAVAVWLPPAPAAAGILVAALADPAASAIGTRFGAVGRKTWPGSAAALVVAAGCLVVLSVPWPWWALVALIATAIERWPATMDDNLLLPPLVGLAVWAVG